MKLNYLRIMMLLTGILTVVHPLELRAQTDPSFEFIEGVLSNDRERKFDLISRDAVFHGTWALQGVYMADTTVPEVDSDKAYQWQMRSLEKLNGLESYTSGLSFKIYEKEIIDCQSYLYDNTDAKCLLAEIVFTEYSGEKEPEKTTMVGFYGLSSEDLKEDTHAYSFSYILQPDLLIDRAAFFKINNVEYSQHKPTRCLMDQYEDFMYCFFNSYRVKQHPNSYQAEFLVMKFMRSQF